jgi:hypothetical protein
MTSLNEYLYPNKKAKRSLRIGIILGIIVCGFCELWRYVL